MKLSNYMVKQNGLLTVKKVESYKKNIYTKSLLKNKRFIDQNGIEFPLISDESKSIRKLYGRGRVTYLIDKKGIVQFIQKGFPDNQDFLNALKKLK